MAGPQASSQGTRRFSERYPVPDKNKPVSTVYFNEVKEYLQSKYSQQLAQWISVLGEKAFYKLLRDEMDKYTFTFPDNQCRWFFAFLAQNKGKL